MPSLSQKCNLAERLDYDTVRKYMTQAEIANFLRVGHSTVAGWKKNGIPHVARLALVHYLEEVARREAAMRNEYGM